MHWGDWPLLRQQLLRGHARRVVEYLARQPGDFRGAAIRLPPELRRLYLSAYQSHLWNRMLARWIEGRWRPEQIVPVATKLGPVPLWRGLDEKQRSEVAGLLLPLPSARWKLDPTDPVAPLVQSILAEDGLELGQMQVKGVRELFFSKGERAARCLPVGLEAEGAGDELNPRKHRLTLTFELPRGSYATLVIKRIASGG